MISDNQENVADNKRSARGTSITLQDYTKVKNSRKGLKKTNSDLEGLVFLGATMVHTKKVSRKSSQGLPKKKRSQHPFAQPMRNNLCKVPYLKEDKA